MDITDQKTNDNNYSANVIINPSEWLFNADQVVQYEYNQKFLVLMEYIIKNDILKSPALLGRTIPQDQKIYRMSDKRTFNSSPPYHPILIYEDDSVFFGTVEQTARSYIKGNIENFLFERQLMPTYEKIIQGGYKEYGANALISLDGQFLGNDIKGNPVYNTNVDLLEKIFDLIYLKYKTAPEFKYNSTNNTVQLPEKKNADGSTNKYYPESTPTLDELYETYGVFPNGDNRRGIRKSGFNTDRHIVREMVEIFGYIEQFIRNQPKKVLNEEMYRKNEHLPNTDRPKNPINIIGYYASRLDLSTLDENGNRNYFHSELTIKAKNFMDNNILILSNPTAPSPYEEDTKSQSTKLYISKGGHSRIIFNDINKSEKSIFSKNVLPEPKTEILTGNIYDKIISKKVINNDVNKSAKSIFSENVLPEPKTVILTGNIYDAIFSNKLINDDTSDKVVINKGGLSKYNKRITSKIKSKKFINTSKKGFTQRKNKSKVRIYAGLATHKRKKFSLK